MDWIWCGLCAIGGIGSEGSVSLASPVGSAGSAALAGLSGCRARLAGYGINWWARWALRAKGASARLSGLSCRLSCGISWGLCSMGSASSGVGSVRLAGRTWRAWRTQLMFGAIRGGRSGLYAQVYPICGLLLSTIPVPASMGWLRLGVAASS